MRQLRSRLETAYSAKLANELSTLGGKIDTIIHVERLSNHFENWYTWANFEASRDKVLTVYQQFEESRRILASDLLTAQSYKKQMLAATESFPEVREPYEARMDNVIDEYTKRLQRLEEKGWQGYLATQRSSANRIVSNPEKLSPICLKAYMDFLDQSGAIDSLETYRVSERIFMKAVMACTRKIS